MSSTKKIVSENWLLVEWRTGGRDVVYVRAVVSPVNKELKVGDALTVTRRGEEEAATLIARAREREMLDSMIKKEETAGPSGRERPEDEEEDYSSSASSWVPSDDGAQSGDSVEERPKKIKLERYKRQYTNRSSTNKMTPSNKANAVLNVINRNRTHNDSQRNQTMNESLPDSTRRNQIEAQHASISEHVKDMKMTFKTLFSLIRKMKQECGGISESDSVIIPSVSAAEESVSYHDSHQQSSDEDKENVNDVSENDEFNRSDDNVLITNRYSNATAKTMKDENGEWVPIGSGKTLIHKDKFNKINWKSYTIATRTLLLAAFPRRILATHSLTGKRSPAFQNKPAKMCLDPKITSDVIIEIMDRFNVRENLVRSIITTKCADECKMWKTRANRKKTRKKQAE